MINNEDKKGIDWKPGIEIFTQVSTWIVVPIILALVFGKILDTYYGTKPVIFLALVGVSFLFSCFGILKVVKKYIKEIKDLSEKK